MKKTLLILLIIVLLVTIPTAYADDEWTCPACGNSAKGNFCNNCGNAKPTDDWTCPDCGNSANGNFCNNCGAARPTETTPASTPINEPASTPMPTDTPERSAAVLWYEEARQLARGTYTVGIDIPAGTYHFWKIDGDNYTSVLYVYDADDLEDEIASGSSSDIGCVLNLKEGQILKLTWTGTNAAMFNKKWSEGETRILPSGSYIVGEDIPAGRYTFTQIDGDKYTAVLYVYNSDDLENEIESGNTRQYGYAVTLKEHQVLKITWTGVNAIVENVSSLNNESTSTPKKTTDNDASSEPTATPETSKKELAASEKSPSTFKEETVKAKLSSGREIEIRKSVKDALDAYEAFMDGYAEALEKISNGDFSGYLTFMEQYEEYTEKIEDIEDNLTEDESWYYYEVSMRVIEKMS